MVYSLWLLWTIAWFILRHLTQADPQLGEHFPLMLGLATLPAYLLVMVLAWIVCGIRFINEAYRVPVWRFGRFVGAQGPGFTFIEPAIHTTSPDLFIGDTTRELTLDNGLQTRDNVPLKLVGLLTFRIPEAGIRSAVVNVANVEQATVNRAIVALTEASAKTLLFDISHNREGFNAEVKKALEQKVENWGVEIVAVEMLSFTIADEKLQEALALKPRAEREGEAMVAHASYQVKVAEKMVETSNIYRDNPGAWRLKAQELLVEVARGTSNLVILPNAMLDSLRDALDGRTHSKSAEASDKTDSDSH